MMKFIVLPALLSSHPLPFLLASSFLMVFSLFFINPEFNPSPESDFLSWSLILLTLWLSTLMMIAEFKKKQRNLYSCLIKSLFLALLLSFVSSSIFSFYFFFEVSLIPIFWIIVGWGYQPERMLASLMMFFYTLISSFPLLISLFLIEAGSFNQSMSLEGFEFSGHLSVWLQLSFVLAFLVKFPMFLFHLWLPKAHVEAPVAGSMILAGVLLKLGGYGICRLIPYFSIGGVSKIFLALSVMGGAALGMLCTRIADMKVLIAYSSVVHMSLIIVVLLASSHSSLVGAWWAMLAHGLVSSGLFAGANIIYEQSHSRSILVNKGLLFATPAVSFFWFILCMSNFGGPFTLNLFSEMNLFVSSLSVSSWLVVPVFLLGFLSAAYSLVLYASSQHGSPAMSQLVVWQSNLRELILLCSHAWPVFIGLLELSL